MRLTVGLILLIMMGSCSDKKNIPDVSGINIELKVKRFERDLFATGGDLNSEGLDQIIARYPGFGEEYLQLILGVRPFWPPDSVTSYVSGFVKAYKAVYDTSQILFRDFTRYENEIRKGMQMFRYHFPDYKLPEELITYIGPVDGYGDALTEQALLVGLHQHLGKNFSLYQTDWFQMIYPRYLADRFEPECISVNAMKNLINDLYPEKPAEGTLLEQMIENGRRLYLLSRLLPEKKEHFIIGYSKEQMEACYKNEEMVWNLFINNNYLQSTDANVIRNFTGEGPKTQELGESSPGNIGSFAGWQIVKKFMEKNTETSLKGIMQADPNVIFEKAKYKP